jgi:hypothetical protein
LLANFSALIADSVTLKNFTSELSLSYSACACPEEPADEPMQYADIAEWQNELLESEETAIGQEYWRKLNIESLDLLTLPFNFSDREVWTVFHSYAFDFSVWEIWGALLHGCKLIVVPLEVTQSPAAFYQLLCSERVTILNQTPSAIRQLIDAKKAASNFQQSSLRLIVCDREAFPTELAAQLLE